MWQRILTAVTGRCLLPVSLFMTERHDLFLLFYFDWFGEFVSDHTQVYDSMKWCCFKAKPFYIYNNQNKEAQYSIREYRFQLLKSLITFIHILIIICFGNLMCSCFRKMPNNCCGSKWFPSPKDNNTMASCEQSSKPFTVSYKGLMEIHLCQMFARAWVLVLTHNTAPLSLSLCGSKITEMIV